MSTFQERSKARTMARSRVIMTARAWHHASGKVAKAAALATLDEAVRGELATIGVPRYGRPDRS